MCLRPTVFFKADTEIKSKGHDVEIMFPSMNTQNESKESTKKQDDHLLLSLHIDWKW